MTDPAVEFDDERTSLGRFLDAQRAILLRKAAGLDRDQLSRTTAASDLTLAGLVARYRDACAASRRAVAEITTLDGLSARARSSTGRRVTLRWILLHMLEETARHNGHADLLREAIDGATGD